MDRVSALLERVQALPVDSNLDWNGLRAEIVEEHRKAVTTDQRSALLGLYKAVMDTVARSGSMSPTDAESFATIYRQEYNLMLITEAVVGVDVDPDRMRDVTRREIEAGRMQPDDELATLAAAGAHFLGAQATTKKLTSWGRFKQWLLG